MIESDDPYIYPGTTILRNRLGIRDAKSLRRIERGFVAQRIAEGVPVGSFDLAHLRSIHRHLFQDIYEWAGELRTVEINKGGHQFQFRRYIETGMADVHSRLMRSRFLRAPSVGWAKAQRASARAPCPRGPARVGTALSYTCGAARGCGPRLCPPYQKCSDPV